MTSNISMMPCRHTHLRATLMSASAGIAMFSASPALAECVNQPSGSVLCSGANGGAQTVDAGGSVNVTTEAGFSVDSAASALVIRGVGPVGYDDANASTLTARGGDGLLAVSSGGNGRVSIRTAGDITGSNRGLLVNNLGTGGARVESTGTVAGGVRGISALIVPGSGPGDNDDIEIISNNSSGEIGVGAENRGGNGSIRITSTGMASGTVVTGFGISAFISVAGVGSDIIIDANNIGGVGGGINSSNRGTGSTSITVNGTLDVAGRQGITANNEAGSTSMTVIVNGPLTSGATGIALSNEGRRDTTVIARAQITSNNVAPELAPQAGNGVNVTQGGAAGNLAIDVAGVDGRAGMLIRNAGAGSVTLDASGLVRGREGRGMEISNGVAGGAVAIGVASVEGATDGLLIGNLSDADVTIAASGPVNGIAGTGLNASTLGALEVDVTDVSGGNTGLLLVGGDVDLRATGLLTGVVGDGLFVQAAGSLDAVIGDSRGSRNGATIDYFGAATANFISSGEAIGEASGIRAVSEAGALFLDVNDAAGGDFGISLATRGGGGGDGGGVVFARESVASGSTVITRGTVAGGTAAIDAALENGRLFTLTNEGTIRNMSGSSADLAIQAAGGPVDILNKGTMIGTLTLDAGLVAPEEPEEPGNEGTRGRSDFVIAEVPVEAASHLYTNAGLWDSIGGINLFGGEQDLLLNLTVGRLIGGSVASTAETTTYSELETLTNQGIITMTDGGFGDIVRTSGDASFAAGSVLAVDVGGTGSDRFIAEGVTTIEAGALLEVSNPQPLVLGTRYTVLESASGVNGSFTFTDQLLSAFLGYRLGQTESLVFVELARLRAFAAAGATPNQIAVGGALDGLAANNPLAQAAVLLPTEAAARAAFDALSGEIHPGVRTAMIEESRLPRHAVLERLDSREGSAVWGQMFGNWGDNDDANGVADLDRETIGGVIGADVALGETAIVGIAGGYLETDLRVPARSSIGKLKTYHLIGYAGVQLGGLGVKVGGGYAASSIATDRTVAFPGISQQLAADYDGSLLHGFTELGYRLPLGGGYVEPFAQIVAIRADTDAFAETGGSAAVAGAKTVENATLSTLGARFSASSAGAFSVGGMVGWQHGFGNLVPASNMRFASGPTFTIIGAARSRDAAVATIDTRLRLSERADITVSYDGVLGSAGQDHSVKAGLRIAF